MVDLASADAVAARNCSRNWSSLEGCRAKPMTAKPLSANVAAITPASSGGLIGKQKLEASYNGSFNIQQSVGFATVVEAGWVFNLRRHGPVADRQLNAIPMFSQYDPANANPMMGYFADNASGKALPDNYFRPIKGLGAMTRRDFESKIACNAGAPATTRSGRIGSM